MSQAEMQKPSPFSGQAYPPPKEPPKRSMATCLIGCGVLGLATLLICGGVIWYVTANIKNFGIRSNNLCNDFKIKSDLMFFNIIADIFHGELNYWLIKPAMVFCNASFSSKNESCPAVLSIVTMLTLIVQAVRA